MIPYDPSIGRPVREVEIVVPEKDEPTPREPEPAKEPEQEPAKEPAKEPARREKTPA
jgi:hypothetical protein